MGDWSDYFEDFPEENPANWIGGRFDRQAAAAASARETKLAREQAKLDAEISDIIKKHSTAIQVKNHSKCSFPIWSVTISFG